MLGSMSTGYLEGLNDHQKQTTVTVLSIQGNKLNVVFMQGNAYTVVGINEFPTAS